MIETPVTALIADPFEHFGIGRQFRAEVAAPVPFGVAQRLSVRP
jgi:hypothetical protein